MLHQSRVGNAATRKVRRKFSVSFYETQQYQQHTKTKTQKSWQHSREHCRIVANFKYFKQTQKRLQWLIRFMCSAATDFVSYAPLAKRIQCSRPTSVPAVGHNHTFDLNLTLHLIQFVVELRYRFLVEYPAEQHCQIPSLNALLLGD